MYLEPNNPSLSFANFLDAAIRDKAEIKPFPYTLEVCRCRYCSYCQNGKCALKRCCCMSERVKAKSCTFAELLRDCFVNFKDNVFQFRLRIACERASELKTCFLDEGHKGRFYEGVSYMRKKDPIRAKSTIDNARAEGYIDTGVKIIIGVVVGAVILGGLYALFNGVILPRLNTEIGEMFNYAG